MDEQYEPTALNELTDCKDGEIKADDAMDRMAKRGHSFQSMSNKIVVKHVKTGASSDIPVRWGRDGHKYVKIDHIRSLTEDVEPLAEVSKDLLRRYLAKKRGANSSVRLAVAKYEGKDRYHKHPVDKKTTAVRVKAVEEDVEQIDEVRSLIRKMSKSVNRWNQRNTVGHAANLIHGAKMKVGRSKLPFSINRSLATDNRGNYQLGTIDSMLGKYRKGPRTGRVLAPRYEETDEMNLIDRVRAHLLESDQLDEVSKGLLKRYLSSTYDNEQTQSGPKLINRRNKRNLAWGKLLGNGHYERQNSKRGGRKEWAPVRVKATESFEDDGEQLDEVSKGLLKRYMKRSDSVDWTDHPQETQRHRGGSMADAKVGQHSHYNHITSAGRNHFGARYSSGTIKRLKVVATEDVDLDEALLHTTAPHTHGVYRTALWGDSRKAKRIRAHIHGICSKVYNGAMDVGREDIADKAAYVKSCLEQDVHPSKWVGKWHDVYKTHREVYKEDVDLDEAVRVDTDTYKYTHRKSPKGVGSWAFSKHRGGIDFDKHVEGKDHIWVHNKSFGEAKKVAQSWAHQQGLMSIHVCT